MNSSSSDFENNSNYTVDGGLQNDCADDSLPLPLTAPTTKYVGDEQEEEGEESSTRRNSTTSSASSFGTSMHVLFNSSRTSSQLDSPASSVPDVDLLNGLDQLLNRITSERFLELRRIQLGDRPVTSGNARDSLENFFHRAIHGPTIQEQNNEGENNRPENVSSDVESLLQLSRVRSALQNGFRNRLEATLSGRVQSSESRSNRTSLPSTRRHPVQSSTPNNHHNRTTPPPPPPVPSQQQQQQQQSSASLQDTVQTSVHLLTESIATDLTRLQSLQVVNNMLRTDFRQELETVMQQRVEASGNGETVAQFIRTLSTSQRRPPTQQQHQQQRLLTINESVSNNEIHQLRQQMQEMKQLMAMSMEIQLDTQRAIRQEVSAIFTAFMQDYLIPRAEQNDTLQLPTLMQPNRSTAIQRGQCVICVEKNVDSVLYQCGHMCVCNACGLQLKMNGQNCPMCRASIRDVIRAYVIDE